MSKRWEWLLVLLAAAIVGVSGLVVGLVALSFYLDPFDARRFDPTAWADAEPQERGPMARDALRHLPPGTSKARVRELLGKPHPVTPAIPGGRVDEFGNPLPYPETWSYDLGSWSGIGRYAFDTAVLYVHFGSDGRVVATEITGG
jgi:hypothetical protein